MDVMATAFVILAALWAVFSLWVEVKANHVNAFRNFGQTFKVWEIFGPLVVTLALALW